MGAGKVIVTSSVGTLPLDNFNRCIITSRRVTCKHLANEGLENESFFRGYLDLSETWLLY